MKCPNCGTENPEGAKFCKNCGFQLSLSQQPPTSTGDSQQQIPQSPPPPPPQSAPTPPPPPPTPDHTTYGSEGKKGQEAWWNSLIFCLLLSIFCCWPVGVGLYWTNPVASKKSKIIFTAIFVTLFFLGIILWSIIGFTHMRYR